MAMTGKRGRPSAADAAARDVRVVDVVVDILTLAGYDALTFDRVAAQAGVAKRTLYSMFGDREGLVRAAVRRQHAYQDGVWDAAVDLREASLSVTAHLLGDEAVGIHRAIVAAAVAHPELAEEFYAEGPVRAQRFLQQHLPVTTSVSAALLFTALLGETHRRRLLALAPAPTAQELDAHVDRTLLAVGLAGSSTT